MHFFLGHGTYWIGNVGNDPSWRSYFSNGLVQPATRFCFKIWWVVFNPIILEPDRCVIFSDLPRIVMILVVSECTPMALKRGPMICLYILCIYLYIIEKHVYICIIYLYIIHIVYIYIFIYIYTCTARARESTQGSSSGLTREKVNLWTRRHIICYIYIWEIQWYPPQHTQFSFATKEKLCKGILETKTWLCRCLVLPTILGQHLPKGAVWF